MDFTLEHRRIGVGVADTYKIKRVDSDYFEEG
jgi:restriction endonuclease Mrr